jgi:hypothetical protein
MSAAVNDIADIVVSFMFPPIGSTYYRYSATREGYEPGDCIGYGETPERAIEDLMQQEHEQ